MATIAFDTLRFVEELKSAGFAEAQAKAIAEAQKHAFAEIFESRDHQAATKSDIAEVMLEIERTRRDIAEIKADTIKWVAGLLLAQAAVVAALVKLV
jgi:hypothetical protein